MTEADKRRFGEQVAMLAAAFRVELTEPLFMAYWTVCEDLTPEAAARAVKGALKSEDHMPSPRKLRALAGPVKPPPVDPLWARGLAAWTPGEQWPSERAPKLGRLSAPERETELDRAVRARMRAMSEGGG